MTENSPVAGVRGRLRPTALATAAVLIGALTAACNSSSPTEGAEDARCGRALAFFGALTGPAATLGVNIKNGAQLAVDQYNAKHSDCTVQLKPFDSEGSPDKAPALARSLVQDSSIVAVVGPGFSGEAEAALPVFEEAGLPIVTPSATRPSLADKGWKVFHRTLASDAAQGPAAATYIRDVLKARKVFVAHDQSAYGAGLAETVREELGPLVVGTDRTAADGKQTDFSTTVTRIKSSGATAFFYGGYYANAGLLAKQLRSSGTHVTLVAGDGVKDPGFIASAGKAAAEGTVVTCPCSPATQAKGTFLKDYTQAFSTAPGTYSDIAYDTTNILLDGIAAGKTSPTDMNTHLAQTEHTGIANTYRFTEKGDLDPTHLVVWAFTYKNGTETPTRKIPLT
jgi:branched-chain amino acid transport system substrate-binding protein